jgi:hypothetical protein
MSAPLAWNAQTSELTENKISILYKLLSLRYSVAETQNEQRH